MNLGYTMENYKVQVLCYADDVVLTAENEDDLQRMLFKLSEQYSMEISTEKTKCVVFAKDLIRCSKKYTRRAGHGVQLSRSKYLER